MLKASLEYWTICTIRWIVCLKIWANTIVLTRRNTTWRISLATSKYFKIALRYIAVLFCGMLFLCFVVENIYTMYVPLLPSHISVTVLPFFGVQIIMYMTISTFIFKTCDHSADIQDCMLKFITIYWNVKSVFCVERAISANSYKHCKRLHFLYKYGNSLHLISWRYMYMFAYDFWFVL